MNSTIEMASVNTTEVFLQLSKVIELTLPLIWMTAFVHLKM